MEINITLFLDEKTVHYLRSRLDTIEHLLLEIKKKGDHMATKDELEAAIATVSQKIGEVADGLTDFAGDFQAAIDELKKQIAAGGQGPDLDPSMAALAALADKATAISTSLAALDATAEGISGIPTPPPAPPTA